MATVIRGRTSTTTRNQYRFADTHAGPGLNPNNPVGTSPASGVADANDEILNSAVAIFKQNQYDQALQTIDQGITQHPGDAVYHEFRSLVLFAKGGLSAGGGHDSFGAGHRTQDGTGQRSADCTPTAKSMRASFARDWKNSRNRIPKTAASRFLLAYHYMTEGYPDASGEAVAAGGGTAAQLIGWRRICYG